MLENEIKIFLKKKKTKSESMAVYDIKIFLKMINKDQLSIGKITPKCEKMAD